MRLPKSLAFPDSVKEVSIVREGQRLSENDDDVLSHRLAVVALSGPDRETLIQATAVTILFVAVAAAYLGALDALFNFLVKKIL